MSVEQGWERCQLTVWCRSVDTEEKNKDITLEVMKGKIYHKLLEFTSLHTVYLATYVMSALKESTCNRHIHLIKCLPRAWKVNKELKGCGIRPWMFSAPTYTPFVSCCQKVTCHFQTGKLQNKYCEVCHIYITLEQWSLFDLQSFTVCTLLNKSPPPQKLLVSISS